MKRPRDARIGAFVKGVVAYPGTLGAILLSTALLWAAGYGFIKARHDEGVGHHLMHQSETQRVSFEAVTHMHHVGMEAYFQTYIMRPEVTRLLLKAHNADETVRAQVRGALLETLQSTYDTLKKRGVRQLQFHTPQTDSFLRFHQPERFGDSLLAERPLVARVNETRLPMQGFETGRVISGFRNVFPIQVEGKHLGTVELSQPFEYLRREIARIGANREYLLVLNAQKVLPKIFDENRRFYAPSCLGEGWLVEDPRREWPDASPAISEASQRVGQTLSSKPGIQEALKKGETAAYAVAVEGKRHYVAFTPIHDIAGELNAYLISFAPAPELDALAADLRVQNALLILFLTLFGGLFYRFMADRHALKNLNRHLADQVKKELALRLSEVHRLNREKELQQALLIQQSKQAEIGSMVGAIAHQWKQPLNAIAVMTQTLMDALEEGQLDKSLLEGHIRQVMKQIAFMSETINDFRSFYKPSKQKEPFNLKEATGSVIDLLRVQLERHNTVITLEGDDRLSAYGYASEFKQVILNLINNAKEAAGNGPCAIRIDIYAQAGSARVSVTDNGGGIAPALLPDKLFEPFNTTKGDAGTGIGLSLSKTIIETKMGGRLSVRNVEGGAQFMIELPPA